MAQIKSGNFNNYLCKAQNVYSMSFQEYDVFYFNEILHDLKTNQLMEEVELNETDTNSANDRQMKQKLSNSNLEHFIKCPMQYIKTFKTRQLLQKPFKELPIFSFTSCNFYLF